MEGACNTQKGNSLGFCNGYAMSFRRMRQCDGRWIWRCPNKTCGGTATSTNKDDLMEDKKHHGHLPNSAVVEVRKRLSNAVSESGFHKIIWGTLLMMPARETLTARLNRHRNKDIGSVNRGERSDDWPESMK
uniref:FLYWCH-type domain-containing protein n=1 Tax=Ditylenchus dipsaci TaxID=166011 RepID=A0A915CKA9_9BILA